jgi:hypothetical protein
MTELLDGARVLEVDGTVFPTSRVAGCRRCIRHRVSGRVPKRRSSPWPGRNRTESYCAPLCDYMALLGQMAETRVLMAETRVLMERWWPDGVRHTPPDE